MSKTERISIGDAVRVGVALHKEGHLEEAEYVYRDILETDPEQPDALHFLGVLMHQMGNSEEGAEYLRQALEQVPDNAGMQLNFGNIHRELGNFEEAETAYLEAIRLAPDTADAHCNLGSLYRVYDRNEESRRYLERAIQLQPRHGEAYHNLGNLLRDEHDYEGAVEHYTRAVELYSGRERRGKASANLASTLRRAGKIEEAEKVLKQWVAREPDSPTARHMLSALTGKNVPARAADDYVRELFDGFANSFDKALGSLQYRAPKMVGERLQHLFPAPSRDRDVLDAGCGTGLAAEFMHPFAARLTGVDLSPVMLEKAEGRGYYDELVEEELSEFLGRHPAAYDLIVSVDTFCYFGALEEVIAAAYASLRPGGTLCFTVEKAEVSKAGTGFGLLAHGRYAHHRTYLEGLLGSAGFTSVLLEEGILRLEGGQPVGGFIVSALRRP